MSASAATSLRVCILEKGIGEADHAAKAVGSICEDIAQPVVFTDLQRLLKHLSLGSVDAVIADLETLGSEDALSHIAASCPEAIILAVSSTGSVTRAVSAMHHGAHDFLVKPYSAKALSDKLSIHLKSRSRRATAHIHKDDARDYPQARTGTPSPAFEQFIGSSPAMAGVYDQIVRMSSSNAPAFITGESGTGKELCAQALHNRSGRHNGPFIAINCSAIPADLMESELFGHAKGSFTGASEDKRGAAEAANGGTLFLDEIGEMDLRLQAKLLRFLQTGMVQRVGETVTRRVDIRIICATNRRPLKEIEAGRFREDLFYRLHVLPITLPALRERSEDILELASAFLRRFSHEESKDFRGFSETAKEMLKSYNWPGNVRQLENTIRQIVVMNDGEHVVPEMLPPLVSSFMGAAQPRAERSVTGSFIATASANAISIEPLWAQEKRIIESTLETFNGNIARAAAALEISPSTIYRKKQSWEERANF
ncbi:sigma-54-dependent Fis family transcriptional regulator [Rhodobacteraceae bacterium RKSG542]|nr:sigma-54-dependent Fis family transcriptional regulator [Pseudovibrio flavus]